MNNVRCSYESFEGLLCKRWAMRGSHFCHAHQPNPKAIWDGASLHPLARLASPEDVFDVLRETLNAARQGRIAPRQAYAVGYLAQILLKVYDRVSIQYRDEALTRQIIPTLADEETAAEAASALAMPLPVQIDESASTAAPPLPRNAAEAEAQIREISARIPPMPPELIAEINRANAELAARSQAVHGKPNGSAAAAAANAAAAK